MGKEIYNTVDYLQTGNEEFLDMFLTRYSKNSPTSLGGEMNCKKIRENTCSNVPDVVQYNQSNKRKD